MTLEIIAGALVFGAFCFMAGYLVGRLPDVEIQHPD